MQKFRIIGNQITFLDSRFYMSEDAQTFVPSVSTILDAFPKGPEFYKWLKDKGEDSDRIRDAAANKGTNVHKMTEDYDNGLTVSLINASGNQTYTMQEWDMFSKYVDFRTQVGPAMTIHNIEMNIVDFDLCYGGTIDRYVTIGDKAMILDIKTSNAIYDSYWLQLAAYRRMFENKTGIKIDAVGVVWLNARTRGTAVNKIQGRGWQLVVREDSKDDEDLFNCTHKLWLSQNKDLTPKHLSYNLSFQHTQTP